MTPLAQIDEAAHSPSGMRRLVALLLVLTACGPRPATVAPAADRPLVVLVSIDGFRADYLARGVTPVLDSLARAGVRAEWMEPSFPTKTFPNHYTLVTGLRPDHHGIIANNMIDSVLGTFSMSIKEAVTNPGWWGGEPIWVTAERQGVVTGPMFWPGSEAPEHGVRPGHWVPWNDAIAPMARADTLLAWLQLPAAERPRFVTLYIDAVDHAGHAFGPASPAVDDSLAYADRALGHFLSGLARLGLAERTDLVVVSDHGMAPVGPGRVIALDDYISLDDVTVADWSPVAMLIPKPGKADAVFRALEHASPAMAVYRKGDIPRRLAFGTNPRVPAIVAIAADGWTITSRARAAGVKAGGNHGFDNTLPSMRALFVASGPDLRRGGAVVAPFANIHVYDLLAHLLRIRPAPNDGSLDSVRAVLR